MCDSMRHESGIRNYELGNQKNSLPDSLFIIHYSPKGYALLLSVVITSAVLSAASALAGIVLSEIRQTREIGSAILALTSAESSIEEGLFILRKGGYELLQSDRSPFQYMPVTGCEPPEDFPTERVVWDGCSLRPFRIVENDFVAFPLTPSDTSQSMQITSWVPGADCGPIDVSRSWIEVASIAWNDENPATPPLFETSRRPYSYASDRDTRIPIPPHTVEVRVRALYCSIAGLNVDLPARVILRATRQEEGVLQTAEVAVPRAASVSGLFDFVIFSECELTKGLSGDRC